MALIPAFAAPASAQEISESRAGAPLFSQGVEQAIYKGVVGNVLDAIPMDPSKRLDLQRTNAVVGNTLLGRSLTVLAGLSNPVLLLGGFVWGLWAASKIRPPEAVMARTAAPERTSGGAVALGEERVAALLDGAVAAGVTAHAEEEPVLLSSLASAAEDDAGLSHSHVIKLWLPQRAHTAMR